MASVWKLKMNEKTKLIVERMIKNTDQLSELFEHAIELFLKQVSENKRFTQQEAVTIVLKTIQKTYFIHVRDILSVMPEMKEFTNRSCTSFIHDIEYLKTLGGTHEEKKNSKKKSSST